MTSIFTTLSAEQFAGEWETMKAELVQHGLFHDTSAATVARTWAMKTYGKWFIDQHVYWRQHLAFIEGAEGLDVALSADEYDQDIRIEWMFDDEDATENALALMFKLAWGGAC